MNAPNATQEHDRPARDHYDVVILGGGLAGLSLARHLLLDTERRVLLLERRDELPADRQKVGESSVQLAGYYFSKVLDLEELLFHEHFMKYNLRFYWKSGERDNGGFEDYSQAYIRPFSNIASYQLDRNAFEGALLERNRADERFEHHLGVSRITAPLDGPGPHEVTFEADGREQRVTAGWVVDTTGRVRLLAQRRKMKRTNPIDHGAFFWWVDGLVDIEKLSAQSRREQRHRESRRQTGHLPFWLATNHFMGEGFWFWVIPLQGKTSLGLVYDRSLVAEDEIFSVEKATEWICREFPLFARDLPQREVLDFGGYRSFSHDCAQTISRDRWALAGEAGRFSDPLYSPGSDLISIYNTLIVDAIETEDDEELAAKVRLYEQLMRAAYSAYEPSYALSYDALGDAEVFSLKYGWELSVYFGFYVFPFLNDLFTERRFAVSYLKAFARLGPLNRGIQQLLSDYFQWKKKHVEAPAEPLCFDFMSFGTLAAAEKTFYEVGVDIPRARRVLQGQLTNLEELARFVYARVASVVVGDPAVMHSRAFVAGIDAEDLTFDTDAIARRWAEVEDDEGRWEWSFDPAILDVFPSERRVPAERRNVLEQAS